MNTLIKTISFKTKKVAYGLSLIKNTLNAETLIMKGSSFKRKTVTEL